MGGGLILSTPVTFSIPKHMNSASPSRDTVYSNRDHRALQHMKQIYLLYYRNL